MKDQNKLFVLAYKIQREDLRDDIINIQTDDLQDDVLKSFLISTTLFVVLNVCVGAMFQRSLK